MDVDIVDLPECAVAAQTADALVVIDVLRACTTMAAALSAGARAVVAVSTVDEARALAATIPDAVLAGEIDGLPIDGFDVSNSPREMASAPVRGRTVVHRTAAGTQGLVRGRAAPMLLAAAFVNARATLAVLGQRVPSRVVFVVTGSHRVDGGDEDRAFADYLVASLAGDPVDPAPYLERVRESAAAREFITDGPLGRSRADVDACAVLDRVAFAMVARPGAGGYPTVVAER